MAEDTKPGAAQNKLGELFVEFTGKGLGVLTKGLGSLGTNFGLAATAAKKATDELTKMSKNAGSNVIGLDKINAVTGLTVKQLQSLKAWATVNNVEFTDFIGQIQSLQQNLLNIRMGKGNVKGLSLLGLDPRSMDYNKPLEALDMIRRRVQQVDEATGVMAMNELGLSQELLYALKQNNEMIDKRLFLNDKEIEQARQQQTEWNKLKATWDAAQQKFITNQGWINKVIEKTINLIDEFVLSSNKLVALGDIFGQIGDTIFYSIYTAIYKSMQFMGNAIKEFKVDPLNAAQNLAKWYWEHTGPGIAYKLGYGLASDILTKDGKGFRFKTPEEVKKMKENNRKQLQQEQIKKGDIIVSKSTDPQKHNKDVPVAQSAPSQKAPQIDTSIPSYIGGNIQLTPAQAKELSGTSSYNLPPLPNIAQTGINNQTKNVTVNITQHVTGRDSQETANNANEQIQKYFNSIQYSNLSGI